MPWTIQRSPSFFDCFGDKKASKTSKLNTIWLETIARVLNMPIELKGNNYYWKTFKRVNYKLSNSTFLVVITQASRCYEQLRVVDDMNDSKLWDQHSKCYG